MERLIRRICRNVSGLLLIMTLFTTIIAPTSNSDAYPTPQNNPSFVVAAKAVEPKPTTTDTPQQPIETQPPETEPAPEETTEPIEEPVETTAPTEAPADIPEEPASEPIDTYIMYFDENDALAMARTLWQECRGVKSKTEQACVAWTICNRVGLYDWGDSIIEVVTYPNAFAHSWSAPITDEMYELALDVLMRWNHEKNGIENVGRVLPPDYIYFRGDGDHNYFRNAYNGNYDIWDYSLPSPYEN